MLNIKELMNNICNLVSEQLDEINSRRYDIQKKADNTLVTAADIYLENLIFEYIKTQIPNVRYIGEESFDFSQFHDEEYVVVLDPIDGTENFCSGLKEWGISFAIWYKGSCVGAFIYLPELQLKLISGERIDYIKHSRITGISSSMDESLLNVMKSPGEYRIMGCAVYNLYNVIKGIFNRFVNPKGAYIWDVLPGIILALEHDCTVLVNEKPYNGELLDATQKYRVDIRAKYSIE